MKVLVVGSGGREHTLVWKIAQSKLVDKVYCAPGNGGIGELAECVDIKADDIDGLLEFARSEGIGLTVVGPEAPLSLGIADCFEQNGMRIFGPCRKGAMLESSKAFSKDFMIRNKIPTAAYKVYYEAEKAKAGLDDFGYPVVIKADGLAAGKGVIIARNRAEAIDAIDDMLTVRKFGEAGSKIVIEEFLVGKEASILAFVDGKAAVPMVSAQDYKRALDNDEGLNTGGMGAVSPAFYYDEKTAAAVERDIIQRTVDALKAEGICYKGVLYFGIMITGKGPKVLEYNARFGDPETEVVLLRLESDLVEIMNSVIDGKLEAKKIKWKEEQAVCVVMASGGYPEHYEKGYEIKGLDKAAEIEGVTVFHAGTKKASGKIVTVGGRVLVISAIAKNYEEARDKAYSAISSIAFEKAHYRKDIGKKD
ncbi:MAG TPA: phosphoribosylamine--glycine ligase [Bacillota bacterium]|nr:phosphoribosylamine--glycine ligase [Bacillota bacterium]HQE66361.1 phosphoribosylamine--glycine ligase [Bacillota bacterium]HQJ37666.1 phosphoribosylamine--glycine ligase [Bacillota bacterium]